MHKSTLQRALAALAVCLFLSGTARAQSADAPATSAALPAPTAQTATHTAPLPATPHADAQIAFADHLFRDGDWYRSITEYRRYLFTVKGRSPHAPRAALAIGEALLRGAQYDAAGRQLDGVAQRAPNLETRHTALFGAGRAYLLDGRPELAKPRFRLLANDDSVSKAMRSEASWLLAWGHFDAGEFDDVKTLMGLVKAAGGDRAENAEGVLAALRARDQLDHKNPLLAGVLSIIPGLGHMYLGQWTVGFSSLVWNALFISAAVLAFAQGNIGTAIVLTAFELGWYSGGIFGAISGALRHNRDVERNWRDETVARFGADRALPEGHRMRKQDGPLPGTLIRFGGAF